MDPSSQNFDSSNPSTRESWLRNSQVSSWRRLTSHTIITQEVLTYRYEGSGTQEDPYRVEWLSTDPVSPLQLPKWRKWIITLCVGVATLAVSFTSTAYSGSIPQVDRYFGVSDEVSTLGLSFYVLGFCIGPMLWAPLSELYGRQIIFIITYFLTTAFSGGATASQNIQSLLVNRFVAGATGASAVVNSAGVISDMFVARERGLAILIFCAAPFTGPVLGPIAGGFLSESKGWRAVEILATVFCGIMLILGTLLIPETYSPYLLIQRAKKLSQITGKVYKSKIDLDKGERSAIQFLKTALSRPWILPIYEPIALCIDIYTAVVYGTLYLTFSAFPIVFQGQRHWSQGIAGLSFLGIGAGQIIAMLFYYLVLEKDYRRRVARSKTGFVAPEVRLIPTLIGCILIPIGLFWFAWTTEASVHWIVPIIGCIPFGIGQIFAFLSLVNYMVDAYTIYAASVLAGNALLRSLFGAIFPLFTTYMYDNLGPQWASSIPAFLSLLCVPFPFIFYKYGHKIRARCKYSAQAKRIQDEIENRILDPHQSLDDEESSLQSETLSSLPQGEKMQISQLHTGNKEYISSPSSSIDSTRMSEKVTQLETVREDGFKSFDNDDNDNDYDKPAA